MLSTAKATATTMVTTTGTHTHRYTHKSSATYSQIYSHIDDYFSSQIWRGWSFFFTNQNLFIKRGPTQPIVPSGLCPSYSSSTSSSTLSLWPFLLSSHFPLSLWPVSLPTPSLLSLNIYIEPTSLYLFLLPVNCNFLCLSLPLYFPILI